MAPTISDLGSALILIPVTLTMLYVAGAQVKYLLLCLPVLGVGVAALIYLEPYRLDRFRAFMNPEADPLIAARYSALDLSGKTACKAALLETMRLPRAKGRVPVIGIVSRLADQKGFNLIGEALESIAAHDLQMVVLGTGQQKYHDMLEAAAARYPEKIAVRLAFDNRLAQPDRSRR